MGLAEPLVWNRRTGVLVGGHQRLKVLDRHAKGADYSLDLAVVDLPPEEERALNIRLNNPGLMGEYDFEGLQKMLADQEVRLDPKALGLDEIDLQALFPEQSASGLFSTENDRAQPDIDQMKEWKKAKKAKDRKGDSAEFYVGLVADSAETVTRFLKRAGLDEGERWHDLRRVAELMGIDLDKGD